MPTSFQFSSEQLTAITQLRAQLLQPAQESAPSAGVPLYSYLFKAVTGMDYGPGALAVLGLTGATPYTEIGRAAVWLAGAIQVNSSSGAFSKVIREFNIRQRELRGFASTSETLLQEASNKVALYLANSILDPLDRLGQPNTTYQFLPTVQEIGASDLNGVRDVLYPGNENPGSELYFNQAWPGIVMLGALGGQYTDRLTRYGENQPVAVEQLADFKSMLFCWDAFKVAWDRTCILDTDVVDVLIGMGFSASIVPSITNAKDAFEYMINAQSPTSDLQAAMGAMLGVGSYKFLDMLMGAVQGKALIGTTTEANFASTAQTFFGGISASSLQILSAQLLPTDASALASLAKVDSAQGASARAALAALSVVRVDVSESVTAQVSLYNPATGQGQLSSEWIDDRAAFTANLYKKLEGLGGIVSGQQNVRFFDAGTGTEVLVGAGSSQRIQRIFGGQAEDSFTGQGFADRLYGGAGNDSIQGLGGADYIEGNAGDDTLIGGEGNDTLHGGAGTDRYELSGTFGNDTILDADGLGSIQIDGKTLGSASGLVKVGETVWETQDRQLVLTFSTLGLIIGRRSSPGAATVDGTLVVRNWQNGQLGIDLPQTAPPAHTTAPAGVFFLHGDQNISTDPLHKDKLDQLQPDGSWTYGTAAPTQDDHYKAGAIRQTDANGVPLRDAEGHYIYADRGRVEYDGRDGNDVIAGYQDNDTLKGGNGDDVIFGGAGSDQIDGGAGNDVIMANHGGDISKDVSWELSALGITATPWLSGVIGGRTWSIGKDAQGNLITGSFAADYERQTGGAWALAPESAQDADIVNGGAGNDYIWGGLGSDVIDGGDDKDQINGLGGGDFLVGGAGNDQIYGDTNHASMRWAQPIDHSTAYRITDQPQQKPEPEVHGNDVIDGGAGDDFIWGDGGDDVLYGGTGNDSLHGDNILLGGGYELDGTYNGVPFHGDDTLDGGAGNDDLTGGGGADSLLGGAGNDTLVGDGDAEVLFGQAHGDDFADGGEGNDYVEGSGGNDTLLGGAGADYLVGDEQGNGLAAEFHGRDSLAGGEGNDTLQGSGGDDSLFGGAGDDFLSGDDGMSSISEGLYSGNDWLDGGDGNDSLLGGRGDDYLSGGSGIDFLFGQSGNDTLVSGEGADYLNGGEGNDTYVFSNASGVADAPSALMSSIVDDSGTNTLVLNGAVGIQFTYSGTVFNVDGRQLLVAGAMEGALQDIVVNGSTSSLQRYLSENLAGSFGMQTFSKTLWGGGGNDNLSAFSDGSTIAGGKGNDFISASNTGNTFIFNRGDGYDRIQVEGIDRNTDASNTLMLGEGILQSDINLNYRYTGELTIDFTYYNGDYLSIKNSQQALGIDKIRFYDGSELNVLSELEAGGYFFGREFRGGIGSDTLIGGAGDDYLYGGEGSDILQGGAGNDILYGQDGADTYLFDIGSGQDTVYNFDNDVQGSQPDTILIGAGLGFSDARFYNSNGSLEILFRGTSESIVVENYFLNSGDNSWAVDWIRFTDGPGLNVDAVKSMFTNGTSARDVLTGFDGDDVLRGGAGDDELSGGAGSDQYLFHLGDGDDLILESFDFQSEDTIVFGSDITPGQITVGRNYSMVTLQVSADDSVTFVSNSIEKFQFSDGSVFDAEWINSLNNRAPAGSDDVLYCLEDLVHTISRYEFGFTPGSMNDEFVAVRIDSLPTAGTLTLGGIAVVANQVIAVTDIDNQKLEFSSAADANGQGYAHMTFSVQDQRGIFDTTPNTLGFDVFPANDAPTGDVILTGAPTQYQTLSAADTLADVDGMGTVSYQWQSSVNGATWNAISGATNRTFVLTAAQVGRQVRVSASYTDGGGTLETVFSAATAAVASSINRIVGTVGADTLSGTNGAEEMEGLAGNDTYVVNNAGDIVIEAVNSGTDLVQSSITSILVANVENLILTGTAAINGTGNDLNNTLTGNGAANVLSGGAGDDLINGAGGADTMIGGTGNDTYVVDNTGDVVSELANGGVDMVQSTVTYTLGANVENLTLTGTASINGTGNALDNVLKGNSAVNVLTGGAGNDTYVVGNGDTTVEASNAGTDTVQSATTWTLAANVENLTLTGSSAVNGTGNALDNVLTGNSGKNTLTGGAGNDIYVVGTGDSTVELANAGIDTVQSSITWTLANNVENLTLTGSGAIKGTGNSLNNLLNGNGAANTLTAGAGNDTLDGFAGADSLVGGAGNDTYWLGRGYGIDTITENDSTGGNTDMARFQEGIAVDQLWFAKSGNNLNVSIIGTNDRFSLTNWYLGNQYHVEQFQTSDGKRLLDTQVQNLVNAMAAFAPPPVGQTSLTASQAASLSPVIAANWQ